MTSDQHAQGARESAASSEPAAPSEAAGEANDELLAQLKRAEAEAAENHDRYLRTAAELENVRKRASRDLEQSRRFAVEKFAAELLPVIDSLELGLEAGSGATVEALLEGKQATLRLLLGALERFGIEPIDPAGEPFDPQLHEAMTMQPSTTAEPGSVLTVLQRGYQLNGRLLRPARVIVVAEAQTDEPGAAPQATAGQGPVDP